MTVRVKPEEHIECWINGEPLQLDRAYQVAGTDLEFSELIGYLAVPDELIAYEVPLIVPEMLEGYLARYSPLAPFDQRFFFPEE
jgi:hypothetical protein